MRIALIAFFITSAALAQTPGQFHPAGRMLFARSGHTTTLLPDGRIFFAGGICPNSNLCGTSTEIFDPATGESRETTPLRIPRKDHSALLIGDGRILLAGGDEPVAGFGRLELIDPATGASEISDLRVAPRTRGSMFLQQSGEIMIGCGGTPGFETVDLNQGYTMRRIHPRGWVPECEEATGISADRALSIDQEKNILRWHPEAGLWDGRSAWGYDDWHDLLGQSLTTLANGKAIIAGGLGLDDYSRWAPANRFELYDPQAHDSTSRLLTAERNYHAACLSPDGLILSGGSTSRQPLLRSTGLALPASVSAELIRLDGSQSERRLQLNRPRLRHTCTLLKDGSVLLAGGESTSEVERYFPLNQWPEARLLAAVPVANGTALELYLTGPLQDAKLEPFVWVDGLPATILYSSPTQINVFVPTRARKGTSVPIRFSDLGRHINIVNVSLE